MFNSILIVCIGNICRSPLGEALFKAHFPDKYIESAGIAAIVDSSADPNAIAIANEQSLNLAQHRAKQLTRNICLAFDLILVMEDWHINEVCKIAPEVRGKVMLFSKWINNRNIPDPYRKNKAAFEQVYHLLEQSMLGWKNFLE